MEWKNIIIAENKTPKEWYGGAWTFCFVYSNKGNILIKGYSNDVDLELDKLKTNHKFFYNKLFLPNHGTRNSWGFYKKDVLVFQPSLLYPKNSHHFKFRNLKTNKELKFKRLPKRWIKELELI